MFQIQNGLRQSLCLPFDIHNTPYIQVNNIFSIVDDLLLKHHSKQKQFTQMMGENLYSGNCLTQVGKDIITFTLDMEVAANHLKLAHNENLDWKLIGRELVISKKKKEEDEE